MDISKSTSGNDHKLEKNGDPIVLVCSADDKYAMPLAVTVRSAIENLKNGCKLNVFIIDGGIKKKNKKKIVESLNTENCTISFISITESLLTNTEQEIHKYIETEVTGSLKHLSIAAYYRLFIPDLIPEQIEKVIYLDCDLIVKGDLEKLWRLNVENYYVLAVQDIMIRNVGSNLGLLNYKKLGLKPDSKYFNSGVLVINLKKWRDDKITLKAVEYLKENRDILRFPDQDVLNALFANKWGGLDPKWNLLLPHALAYSSWQESPFSEDIYDSLIHDPHIIHFSSELKPWNSRHPKLKKYFFEFVDLTAWSGWRLTFWRRVWITLRREFRKTIRRIKK